MKQLFFCIDDAQPCLRQCRACAETVAINNAWEIEQRELRERQADVDSQRDGDSRDS